MVPDRFLFPNRFVIGVRSLDHPAETSERTPDPSVKNLIPDPYIGLLEPCDAEHDIVREDADAIGEIVVPRTSFDAIFAGMAAGGECRLKFLGHAQFEGSSCCQMLGTYQNEETTPFEWT